MNNLTIKLISAGLWLAATLLPRAAMAQPTEPPVMAATRLLAGERVPVDGRLDHPAWARAAAFDAFVEKEPSNGARPAFATRVRLLYDEHALYVGIEAADPQPEHLRALPVRHDGVNRSQDFVVAYIDAVGSRQSAQFFRVNAAGSTADGMHTHADDNEDFSPDFDWDGAARRHDGGYDVVMRIPFASLRYPSRTDSPWRIMVARRVPRDQFYLIASVPMSLDAPSFIASLQRVDGLVPPTDHQFLTLRPSLTLRRETQRDGTGAGSSRNSAEASLDAKWRPLAELVVDATLNPDFSQLALDVPQLAGNSQFALFFPEKRPFFFESSDLLRSPTDALYTRSLTQPRGGLRATWRGSDLAGTVFAIDDRGGGLTLLPGAFSTGYALQPGSSVLAARLRHDQGGLQLGGLMALRRYEQGRGVNDVFGPDVGWQIDNSWRLRAQWLRSSTTAQDDGAGGLSLGPRRDGDRQYLRLMRQSDDSENRFVLDQSDAGFRHDSGFVNQVGVRTVELYHGQVWRRVGWANEFWALLTGSQTRDRASGERVQEYVTPGIWIAGPHNLQIDLQYRGYSLRRVAAGLPILRENYWKGSVLYSPAPWLPQFETGLSLGRMADMVDGAVRPGGQFNIKLMARPWNSLEFEPSAWYAWFDGGGIRHYRESAAQLLSIWHFDARSHLRAIVQRSTLQRRNDSNVLTAHAANTVGSLTYGWRRSAGTTLYLGVTRSNTGYPAAARANEAFIKLQVDLDDARGLW